VCNSLSLEDRIRQLTGKITVKKLAPVLEIHPITLYRWVESNKIPYKRVGQRIDSMPKPSSSGSNSTRLRRGIDSHDAPLRSVLPNESI
jgi:excisionase family DNA binding protein